MYAFSEMGATVTDTPLRELEKLKTSQKVNHELYREWTKGPKCSKNVKLLWKISCTTIRKTKHKTPKMVFLTTWRTKSESMTRKPCSFQRPLDGNNGIFRPPRPGFQQPQWQNQNHSSYAPRQVSKKNKFSTAELKIFFPATNFEFFTTNSNFSTTRTKFLSSELLLSTKSYVWSFNTWSWVHVFLPPVNNNLI